MMILMATLSLAACQQPQDAAGEAAFASACSKCHKSTERLAPRIKGNTLDEKQAWLEKFLAGHHAPDAEVRAELIAFLLKE
jgi:cytochrome c5